MPLTNQEKDDKNDKPWLNFYGSHVPEKMVYENITLIGYLLRTVKEFPDQSALNYKGFKVSYAMLLKMVNTFSCCLKKFGIKKGDCVGLMMTNVISFAVSYFATLKIGGVVVLIDPKTNKNDLEYILNDAGIKVAVTMDTWANQFISLRKRTKLERVIYTSTADYLPFPQNKLSIFMGRKHGMNPRVNPARDLYAWKDILAERPLIVGEESIGINDVAMVQYTMGSDGIPRGVLLTHRNLSSQVQQVNAWFAGFKKGHERLMAALSFFLPTGITMAVNWPMINGWEILLVPNQFPEILGKVLRKTKPGLIVLESKIMVDMLKSPDIKNSDFSSIRGCFLGDAPIPENTLTSFESKTGMTLVQMFGMAETTAITHIHPVSTRTRKIGSIGVPISDTECRIADFEDPDNDMPMGQPGELLIKGPQVMFSYLGHDVETIQSLTGKWLHTGVVAYMDEDGYFYVVDSVRDMIVSDGFNIYPREIDDVVNQHPKVSEACTVGVPHKQKGEAVKLFVVLKKGEKATPEEFIDFCKDKIDPYKWPSQVEIREELPKNTVGRIIRQKLKQDEIRRTH